MMMSIVIISIDMISSIILVRAITISQGRGRHAPRPAGWLDSTEPVLC